MNVRAFAPRVHWNLRNSNISNLVIFKGRCQGCYHIWELQATLIFKSAKIALVTSLIALVTCLISLVTSQHSDFWALFTDRFTYSQLRDSTFVSLLLCILRGFFCAVFCVFYLWSCVFLSLSAGRQPTWAGSTVPPSQHLLPARHCWLFHRVYFANFIFCQESSPFLCCKSTFAPRLPVPVWSVPTTWYLMSLEQGLADDSNYRFRWLLRHF